MILIDNSLEKRNLDKSRGSLLVNDLLFDKKKDEFIAPPSFN